MNTNSMFTGIGIVAVGLASSVAFADEDSCMKQMLDLSDRLLATPMPASKTVKVSSLLDAASSHCKAGQFSEAEAELNEARRVFQE